MNRKKEINKQPIIVKKERLISISVSLKSIIYLILTILFLIFLWYILYFKLIYIYIHKRDNKYESLLFSIIVSMTLLMFQLACGFDFKFSNIWIKFISVIFVIVLVYYGYQNYGLGFKLYENFGLLYHITYESNSKQGLLFFIENWLFWSFIFIASLILMSRD